MSRYTATAGQLGYGGLSWYEHWYCEEGATPEAIADVAWLLAESDERPAEMPSEPEAARRWVEANYDAGEIATMRAEAGLCAHFEAWLEGAA